MTRRFLTLLFLVSFMYSSLPALAEDATLPAAPSSQDAVTVKVPQSSLKNRWTLGILPGYPKMNFAFPNGQSQPTEPAKQSQPTRPSKQWTKGGKIMTIIGAGLIAGGAVETTQKNTTLASSCSGNSCSSVNVDWRDTGIVTIAAGAALVVVGLTRRH